MCLRRPANCLHCRDWRVNQCPGAASLRFVVYRDFPLPLGGPEVNNISILIGGGVDTVSIMNMAFECLRSTLMPPSKTNIKRVANPPLTPPRGRGNSRQAKCGH